MVGERVFLYQDENYGGNDHKNRKQKKNADFKISGSFQNQPSKTKKPKYYKDN